MKTTNENARLVRAVKAVGIRAVKVVERACGDGPWTEEAVLRAAAWLEEGAKEGGVNRPWPNLAARLRNLVKGGARGGKTGESAAATPPARVSKEKAKEIAKEIAPELTPSDTAPASARSNTPTTTAPIDPAAMPFSEFCEKYLKHLEKEGKSRGTVFSYSLDLAVAARHFSGTRDVKTITVEDVAAYFESDAVTKNKGGGAKNAITIAKLRRTLRMALEWGAKAGWLWVAPIPMAGKPGEAANIGKAEN